MNSKYQYLGTAELVSVLGLETMIAELLSTGSVLKATRAETTHPFQLLLLEPGICIRLEAWLFICNEKAYACFTHKDGFFFPCGDENCCEFNSDGIPTKVGCEEGERIKILAGENLDIVSEPKLLTYSIEELREFVSQF